MHHVVTVNEIISFILRYRYLGNAFKNETPETLLKGITIAIEDKCMVVDSDEFGFVRGVIIGEIYPRDKRIHIDGILTISRSSFPKFAVWLKKTARADWIISARRYGREITYPAKLLDKIIKFYG